MMDRMKRVIVFIFIAASHFLLQATMMLLSLASKVVFYTESMWTVGGVFTFVSSVLYQVLAFPFVFVFQKWPIGIFDPYTYPILADVPYYLNSLLWASVISWLYWRNKKGRKSKYQFVRGVTR